MPEPHVESIRFVLQVTFSDGTVIEGAAAPLHTSVYHVEDASIFAELNQSIQEGLRVHPQESILSMMANELKGKTRSITRRGGEEEQDIYDQCLESAKFHYRMNRLRMIDDTKAKKPAV